MGVLCPYIFEEHSLAIDIPQLQLKVGGCWRS
jgi:hypothetical protein